MARQYACDVCKKPIAPPDLPWKAQLLCLSHFGSVCMLVDLCMDCGRKHETASPLASVQAADGTAPLADSIPWPDERGGTPPSATPLSDVLAAKEQARMSASVLRCHDCATPISYGSYGAIWEGAGINETVSVEPMCFPCAKARQQEHQRAGNLEHARHFDAKVARVRTSITEAIEALEGAGPYGYILPRELQEGYTAVHAALIAARHLATIYSAEGIVQADIAAGGAGDGRHDAPAKETAT